MCPMIPPMENITTEPIIDIATTVMHFEAEEASLQPYPFLVKYLPD